jgi:uncharacterized membrane protein
MRRIVAFATVLLTALLVGTMFGIWFGYDPHGISGPAYVEVQQSAIRALNVPMPVLGAICVLLCLVCAYLNRGVPAQAYLYLAAAGLFIVAGLITRLLNQPINAVVMTWSPQSLPPEWELLRDQWWQWHILRTGIGIVGFTLLTIASQARGSRI